MGDPERRGAVVEWVRTVGDPWIQTEHPPAPGSPLAGDDKAEPKVSAIARFGIATAVDHLGLVVDAMESDRLFRIYAPLTALRTALYTAAHTQWLLTPRTRAGRQVRALRMELKNQVEQRKAISGFTGDHMSAHLVEERDKAVESVKAHIETLKERGANLVDGMAAEDARALLGGAVLTEPLNMVEILQGLVDEHTDVGQGIGRGLHRVLNISIYVDERSCRLRISCVPRL